MGNVLKQISDCIVNMEEDEIESLIQRAVKSEIDLDSVYIQGLKDGMVRAIELFDKKIYHLPEVIVCADTLNKGLNLLKSFGDINKKSKGKIVFAVVKGDTHEIGKNIVKIMLEASGYEVIDLGVNVDSTVIIESAIKEEAQIIALSSMMTTTMIEMERVIKELSEKNIKYKPHVIVGGGCVSKKYAEEILADGYSENAPKAVKLVNRLIGGKK
ncbi:cobalamin-dependent protein [Lutibacter sp. B2]|nr:cobalamin-dependent protein [Lutibacter sp. B2]